MTGHHHGPNALPVHPGNPNVNVDPRIDGRQAGPGRKPGSGALTNPSEWTTKPDYQTKRPRDLSQRGYHSDWAAQESYAQIPGIPADQHMYFSYPELDDYWSAEQGEVPEPYVAAAYVKWFILSWENAYDKPGKSKLENSASLEDIAAAIERGDPQVLEVLSRCATDHHIVAEVSRDSIPGPLSSGKESGKNASVVPFAIQHLVEIVPKSSSDFRLMDKAGKINDKRLKANSHAAGAGSTLNPTNPMRSQSVVDTKSKHNPDHIIHHVTEELKELSEGFARLAFRNGDELSKAVATAVRKNQPADYAELPEYVGTPALGDTNYRRLQHQHSIQSGENEIRVYIDPSNDRVIDSIGYTLVRFEGERTILCFGPESEIAVDETLSIDEAITERNRLNELFSRGGSIALSDDLDDAKVGKLAYRSSDVTTRSPLLSRVKSLDLGIVPRPEKQHETEHIKLTNGELLNIDAKGTIGLSDGTIVSHVIKVGPEEKLFTKILGEEDPLITEGTPDPVITYKNFLRINPRLVTDQSLNEIWKIEIEKSSAPEPTAKSINVMLREVADAGELKIEIGGEIVKATSLGRKGKFTPDDGSEPYRAYEVHYLDPSGTARTRYVREEELKRLNLDDD